MSTEGTCALCGRHAPLLKSHAVPKFVADWMKKTGATGYIRNAKTPNLRRQDFETFRMLCFDCEQRLSRWEKQFCEQLYVPFQTSNQQAFFYDEWLLRFAVSLAWRTVWRTRDHLKAEKPQLLDHVDAAADCWRDFLLEKRIDAGPYEHHLFFFEYLSANNINVPDKFHTYTLTAVDSTIASTDDEVWAYTKLPGIAFWTGVYPAHVPSWHGGLIKPEGYISSPQIVNQGEFGMFLNERVNMTTNLFSQTSAVQREKIRKSALQDPQRLLNSKSFEVFLADSYWRERLEEQRREAHEEEGGSGSKQQHRDDAV